MSGMLAEFPSWEGPGVGRIMGREHLQNPDVNRSHEPTPNPSGGGESMSRHACEFPSWEGPGVGRFMGREHLQNSDVNRRHEPTPNPSGGGEAQFRVPHSALRI